MKPTRNHKRKWEHNVHYHKIYYPTYCIISRTFSITYFLWSYFYFSVHIISVKFWKQTNQKTLFCRFCLPPLTLEVFYCWERINLTANTNEEWSQKTKVVSLYAQHEVYCLETTCVLSRSIEQEVWNVINWIVLQKRSHKQHECLN